MNLIPSLRQGPSATVPVSEDKGTQLLKTAGKVAFSLVIIGMGIYGGIEALSNLVVHGSVGSIIGGLVATTVSAGVGFAAGGHILLNKVIFPSQDEESMGTHTDVDFGRSFEEALFESYAKRIRDEKLRTILN